MSLQILRDSYCTILSATIIYCYLWVNREKYGKNIARMFMITVGLALIESMAGSAERFLANGDTYHPMRLVLSWMCYCVAPGILLSVAETIMRKSAPWKRWLIAVPEMVNIMVTSTAFFAPWCFSMDASRNHFIAGPLIDIPRYSIIVYLVIAVLAAMANVRNSKYESITVIVVAILIAVNYIDETQFHYLGNVREITIAISVLAYFMYFTSIQHRDEVTRINEEFFRNEARHTKEMLDQSIETLAYTIDAKDRYTRGHSSRVASYARMIGKVLGKTEEECRQIFLCGLLHDIGKISVSGAIINKPDRLTDEEYEKIKKHPLNGAKILEKMKDIPYLREGARYHHERYDGKGYPEGLAGEEIPEIARIIAVADAYDAMTSYRSYRPAMDQVTVKQEIWKGMGTQFDPLFAKVMISLIDADINYEMREIPGETGEIEFDAADKKIVWSAAPKGQNADAALTAETDENVLARFINAEDKWADPSDNFEITDRPGTIRFHSTAGPDAMYVWNSPAILVYSSDDGTPTGAQYDELGVFMSAGYSWSAGSSDYEYASFSKNDAFESWDNWIAQNKAGMDYFVDYIRKGTEIQLKIYNELLTMEAHLVLKEGYKNRIYLTVSGERCTISDIGAASQIPDC